MSREQSKTPWIVAENVRRIRAEQRRDRLFVMLALGLEVAAGIAGVIARFMEMNAAKDKFT